MGCTLSLLYQERLEDMQILIRTEQVEAGYTLALEEGGRMGW